MGIAEAGYDSLSKSSRKKKYFMITYPYTQIEQRVVSAFACRDQFSNVPEIHANEVN